MLGLIWVLRGDIIIKLKKIIKNPYAISMGALYFTYLISLFYSDNTSYAYKDLILKSPLLLIPLFLGSSEKITQIQFNNVLKVFAISTFLSAIITIAVGYYKYTQTGLVKYFFYHDLTIFMHSAYYGLYSLCAITIFIYLFHNSPSNKKKVIYSIMALGLSLFLFLLSSRMQILIFLFALTIYILALYVKKRKIYFGIFILLLSYVGIFFLVTKMPKTSVRLQQTKEHIKNINFSKTNSDARVQIWFAAINVIKSNYLLGTGVGDVKDVLLNEYELLSKGNSLVDNKIEEIKRNRKWLNHIKIKAIENNIKVEDQLYEDAIYVLNDKRSRYKYFIKKGYNYHSQYFQTISAVGILGLFLLLFSLLFPIYKLGYKKKKYLLSAFLIMFFISFISESFLEREAGVILYAFFSSFLSLDIE
tara:strand:- start:42902 stop:44155 length:1254 start_codon:yes stop_codon:yes gene_type:complete